MSLCCQFFVIITAILHNIALYNTVRCLLVQIVRLDLETGEWWGAFNVSGHCQLACSPSGSCFSYWEKNELWIRSTTQDKAVMFVGPNPFMVRAWFWGLTRYNRLYASEEHVGVSCPCGLAAIMRLLFFVSFCEGMGQKRGGGGEELGGGSLQRSLVIRAKYSCQRAVPCTAAQGTAGLKCCPSSMSHCWCCV